MKVLHGLTVAFAGAWLGTVASSQTPAPDWSGSPGPAVASAGDVNADGFDDVIVGGYGFDNGQADEGRACVYLGSASGLAPTPVWTVESNQAGAYFGWAVAGAGDVNGDGFDDVLVGAPYLDSTEGRASLYLGSASGPSTTPSWTEDGLASYYLGWDLAAAGDVNGDGFDDVIIGIPGDGRAEVWLGSPSGTLVAIWQVSGPFGGVGNIVSGAGDVNGDGFDEVMVGVPFWEPQSVYVFPGTPGGPSLTQSWVLESGVPDYEFGREVAPAGDVNGDGFDDIAVRSGNVNLLGRVTVFHGSPGGPTLVWTTLGEHDGFGFGLAAGDVNGDGFDDLIVGASDYDVTPNGNHGRVVVFQGSSAGLSGPAWSATGLLGSHLGVSVGAADANGDGYTDMLVTDDPAYSGNGAAYAYLGSSFGLDDPPGPRRGRGPRVRFP